MPCTPSFYLALSPPLPHPPKSTHGHINPTSLLDKATYTRCYSARIELGVIWPMVYISFIVFVAIDSFIVQVMRYNCYFMIEVGSSFGYRDTWLMEWLAERENSFMALVIMPHETRSLWSRHSLGIEVIPPLSLSTCITYTVTFMNTSLPTCFVFSVKFLI